MKPYPSLPRQPGRSQEHRAFLGDGFELLVRYRLDRGEVVDFAVVLFREQEETVPQELCRYDTAHGFAHLDILTRSGSLRKKIRILHLPGYKEVFEYAIADLKTNREAYWRGFISS
jgi:hypothetical protein